MEATAAKLPPEVTTDAMEAFCGELVQSDVSWFQAQTRLLRRAAKYPSDSTTSASVFNTADSTQASGSATDYEIGRLVAKIADASGAGTKYETVHDSFEKAVIEHVLGLHGHNQVQTAKHTDEIKHPRPAVQPDNVHIDAHCSYSRRRRKQV